MPVVRPYLSTFTRSGRLATGQPQPLSAVLRGGLFAISIASPVWIACVASAPQTFAQSSVTTPTAADPPAADPAPTAEQLAKLVEQLGADSFQQRERATSRLLAAGPQCLPILRKQAEQGDLETRQRVEMIVARLMADEFEARVRAFLRRQPEATLPGWEYAREKLADSNFFRQLYVDISRKRPAFVQQLGGTVEQRRQALTQLTSDLEAAKRTITYNPNIEDCVAMLLVASDPEIQNTDAHDTEIFALMRRFEIANALQDAELAGAVKRMVRRWIVRIGDARLIEGLILGMDLELPAETLQLAERILRGPNQDPVLIQFGLKALARFGEPPDAALARPFLDDDRPGGNIRFDIDASGRTRRVRVGDLAMAAIALVHDRNLRGIGFPAAVEHPRWGFDESSVGFPVGEEGDRQRARVREQIDALLEKNDTPAETTESAKPTDEQPRPTPVGDDSSAANQDAGAQSEGPDRQSDSSN